MRLHSLFIRKWLRTITQTVVVFTLLSLSLYGCGGGGGNDAGGSSDASLSELTLDGIVLDKTFQADQLNYNASVDFSQDSITLTPVASDTGTTIRINDTEVTSGAVSAPIDLAVGENRIDILVTSGNRSTTQTYTLTISRATASSDASLSDLSLAGATLDQLFQPSQTTYSASVDFLQAGVTLTPVATDDGATIHVNGTEVTSGNASAAIVLSEGQNTISLVVTAEDGVTTQSYSIDIMRDDASSFAQQAYIKASNADGGSTRHGYSGDKFGSSVAISGDTLVVGAPGRSIRLIGIEWNDSKIDYGAVYVFTRSNGVWSQQAYLEAGNSDDGDQFGASVAISGDTIVVGAIGEDSSIRGGGEDNSARDAGAVYVFTRSGGVWNQQALLKASFIFGSTAYYGDSSYVRGNEFGYSVAISGDTLVVGSPNADSSDDRGVILEVITAHMAGAVFVFTRSDGVWSQQASLKASNAEEDDGFGTSVAISNDTVVVGAPYEDSNASGGEDDNSSKSRGAAYVFTRSEGTWSQQAYLKAGNIEGQALLGASGDYSIASIRLPYGYEFGTSVAVSDDTLVVGANQEVYVFTRNSDSWSQQASLKASIAEEYDGFGTSVTLSGDTLVVGAPYRDGSATGGEDDNSVLNSGTAYVFTRSGGVWSQQANLNTSNAEGGDEFGTSVAISGDTLVVGAPGEDSSATGGESDNSAPNAGAAYVW
jgi:hypothetical protein